MISTIETLHEALDELVFVTGGKSDDPNIQRVIDAKVRSGFDLASVPSRDQLDTFVQVHGGTITGEAADTSYHMSRDAFRLIVMGLRIKQDYNVMTVVDMTKVSLYMADYLKTLDDTNLTMWTDTEHATAHEELVQFFRYVCNRMNIEDGLGK